MLCTRPDRQHLPIVPEGLVFLFITSGQNMRKWTKPEGWQPALKGKGRGLLWIKAHLDYEGDDCLPWPFPLDSHGYGQASLNGKIYKASRLMCILKHGSPPTPKHEAAHSCGNGALGCMNHKHISWKTRSENQQDRVAHGRAGRLGQPRYKLNPIDVIEIRKLAGKQTNNSIAKLFGVSASLIIKIKKRELWPHV